MQLINSRESSQMSRPFFILMVPDTNDRRIDIQFDCSSVSGSHGLQLQYNKQKVKTLKLPVGVYSLSTLNNLALYRCILRQLAIAMQPLIEIVHRTFRCIFMFQFQRYDRLVVLILNIRLVVMRTWQLSFWLYDRFFFFPFRRSK